MSRMKIMPWWMIILMILLCCIWSQPFLITNGFYDQAFFTMQRKFKFETLFYYVIYDVPPGQNWRWCIERQSVVSMSFLKCRSFLRMILWQKKLLLSKLINNKPHSNIATAVHVRGVQYLQIWIMSIELSATSAPMDVLGIPVVGTRACMPRVLHDHSSTSFTIRFISLFLSPSR